MVNAVGVWNARSLRPSPNFDDPALATPCCKAPIESPGKRDVAGRLQSRDTLVWSAASRPGMAVLSFKISDLTRTRPASGVAIDEDTHRQQQPSAGGSDFCQAGLAAGQGQYPPLLRQRDLRRDPGKCPRRGHVRPPVD